MSICSGHVAIVFVASSDTVLHQFDHTGLATRASESQKAALYLLHDLLPAPADVKAFRTDLHGTLLPNRAPTRAELNHAQTWAFNRQTGGVGHLTRLKDWHADFVGLRWAELQTVGLGSWALDSCKR